jgi:hypothetical protein
MLWGQARGDVVIAGELAGRQAVAAHASLYAMVNGPVTPIPALAYLGVVTSGQGIDRTIFLKLTQRGVHLANIHSPEGVTVSVGLLNNVGDLPLHIHWVGGGRFGRMEEQITVTTTAPLKGTLRIPLVGFVMPPRQHAPGAACEAPLHSSSSVGRAPSLISFVPGPHAVASGFDATSGGRVQAPFVERSATSSPDLVGITDL